MLNRRELCCMNQSVYCGLLRKYMLSSQRVQLVFCPSVSMLMYRHMSEEINPTPLIGKTCAILDFKVCHS